MLEETSDIGRLHVPLCDAACGVSLRLFRDRSGARCAVGFTSPDRLAAVLGPGQRYYRLTGHAVRALARERGVTALIVDPGLVAPAVSPLSAEPVAEPAPPLRSPLAASRPSWHPELAGRPVASAVTGAAAPLTRELP